MKFVGWFSIIMLTVSAVVGADILYGRLSDISLIRQDALNFRNEAAYTIFSTKNIVPEINHSYRFPFRDEGEELLETTEPRRFRSNKVGAVEPAPAAAEGMPRIVFLGGSTTENNEVDEPFRFPAKVGKILEENGMDAVTLNFGVRGHTSIDSINVLINRHNHLAADYVILMHNINDRFRSASDRGYTALPGTERVSSFESVWAAARHLGSAVWDFLSYRSNALFTLRFNENINDAFREDRGPKNDSEGNIVVPAGGRKKPNDDAFSKNLRVFVSAARSYGIIPILMTQPLGYRDVDQGIFNDVIREVASSEDVWLIDLDAMFGNDPRWAFLGDGIHFNNQGSIAAAEAIAAKLSEKIWGTDAMAVIDRGAKVVALTEFETHCSPKTGGEFNVGEPWLLGHLTGRYPSVSADGNWLLYQERVGSADRIRLGDLRTGRVHDIDPEDSDISERHPAFIETSDNSVKLVYGRGAEDNNPTKVEHLVELTWPEITRRAITPKNLSASIPGARGGRLVFAGSTGRAPDLYEIDLATGQINQLTKTPWEEWRPSISPSGNLYFISNNAENFDIYMRDPNGNVKLVWGSPADEWDPAVDTAGDTLAFASRRSGSWDIYALPLKETTDVPVQVTSSSGDEWDPSFADDAGALIFAKSELESSKLMGVCLYDR